ncbi:hypothetical protein PG984_015793 [Apiospora sp. TS-2023a]
MPYRVLREVRAAAARSKAPTISRSWRRFHTSSTHQGYIYGGGGGRGPDGTPYLWQFAWASSTTPSDEPRDKPKNLPKDYFSPYLSAGILPGIASAAGGSRGGSDKDSQRSRVGGELDEISYKPWIVLYALVFGLAAVSELDDTTRRSYIVDVE